MKARKVSYILLVWCFILMIFVGCDSLENGGLMFNEVEGGYQVYGVAGWERLYNVSSIYIPSEYNGKPVVAIADNAFSGYTSLLGVSIPNTVKTIGCEAFSGCILLQRIDIPDSVTHIEGRAFKDCIGLTEINIPDSVIQIGSNAFDNCDSLNYKYYDNFKYLGNSNNPYLFVVGIVWDMPSHKLHPDTKGISDRALINCENMKSIVIPDGVVNIGDGAFISCKALTSITIPDSVITIERWAFYDCDAHTNVVIPDGITTIGEGAFSSCEGLTSIVLPDSLKMIEDRAFMDCINLKEVYYTGSQENWAKIAIVGGWNDSLTNANVTYNYVVPASG